MIVLFEFNILTSVRYFCVRLTWTPLAKIPRSAHAAFVFWYAGSEGSDETALITKYLLIDINNLRPT